MLMNAPNIEEISEDIKSFTDNTIFVEHSSSKFDTKFLENYVFKTNNLRYISTYTLAKKIMPEQKELKLNTLADSLQISIKNHHQAVDDAKVTVEIFMNLLKRLIDDHGIDSLEGLFNYLKK